MCVCVGGDWLTLTLDTLSAPGEKLPSSASFRYKDFKDFQSKCRLCHRFPAQEEFPSSVVSDDSVASLSLSWEGCNLIAG